MVAIIVLIQFFASTFIYENPQVKELRCFAIDEYGSPLHKDMAHDVRTVQWVVQFNSNDVSVISEKGDVLTKYTFVRSMRGIQMAGSSHGKGNTHDIVGFFEPDDGRGMHTFFSMVLAGDVIYNNEKCYRLRIVEDVLIHDFYLRKSS